MVHKKAFCSGLILAIVCVALAGTWSYSQTPPVKARILAVNDFHGQLQAFDAHGKTNGGAASLVAMLRAAAAAQPDRTVIALAGDTVGASPADAALLHDEPALMVLGTLANSACADKQDPRCNMVSTLGNHEFDKDVPELLRQIRGGNAPQGPYLQDPWPGAAFPYVCANVRDKTTGKLLVAPYVIKKIGEIPVAFIGAVVRDTPSATMPRNTARLEFLDEAASINSYLPEIQAKGVHAIVAIIHQGGNQPGYDGPTDPAKPTVSEEIVPIVNKLDADVDIVISGHTHKFTNALVPNAGGRNVLVTQAYAKGTAFAAIDLDLDPASGEIVNKSAAIITTTQATAPDPAAADIVARADAAVAPLIDRVVGHSGTTVSHNQNAAGESPLGNLVVDSHRKAGATDFAFMNPGGIRADLEKGPLTWGALYNLEPFGDSLITMELTGEQIAAVLAQQWSRPDRPRILQVSGLRYTWTDHGPGKAGTVGAITRQDGSPIDKAATYTVTVNSYLAEGGDGFKAFTQGKKPTQLQESVVDALIAVLQADPAPAPDVQGRIIRIAP